MKDVKSKRVVAELKRLSALSGGTLQPEQVVRAAASRESALHSYFTWKDTKAAGYWRLHQARGLLRAVVEVIDEKLPPVRVFVSLSQDRGRDGYRSMVSILDDKELRFRMLQEARLEMEGFIEKYKMLKELSHVFLAIRTTVRRIKTGRQSGLHARRAD